ncbi:YbjQ family protein [Candidatus Acetothermia bacterium]|jgi:uncharacterized protein YbjQ (UPF0145 family)|nr:YbjQ family protein [Candidatus Acetothermia bacterium]MCI2427434.1 YbjQ family protein [Candidatus Acetothermia bacterium]MCI2428505.1 YbjQ family protein [Candidatus Acetothermia bacterium]
MLIITTEQIPGQKIDQALGLVKGSTIRARHIGKDILAGLRNIVGGEIEEYTQMLNQVRKEAITRMVREAEELNADAIIGVRFTSAQTMAGAAEILVYGTAVKLSK